jgi:F-type H+-transporting ATPase subunit c
MVKKLAGAVAIVFVFLAMSAPLVLAQEHAATTGAAAPHSVNYFVWTVIVAGFSLAIAAAACGLAQAQAIARSVEGIARQPEAAPKIQLAMMIGLAFIESLVLYILFIGIILLFVNPFAKYFIQ